MSELAADGVPVAVACRVLKLARQPYHRWLVSPVSDAEVTQAYQADALDVRPGRVTDLQANGRWSAFGKKKRGKGSRPGPPVHDDLVERDLSATGPNRLWLADITEHPTSQGKVYLCAVKDVWSGRIVGYAIDSRMKATLAVTALDNAVARRGQVAGCVLHRTGAASLEAEPAPRPGPAPYGRVHGPGRRRRDNAAMESFFALLQNNVLDRRTWATREQLCAPRSSPGSNAPSTAAENRPASDG